MARRIALVQTLKHFVKKFLYLLKLDRLQKYLHCCTYNVNFLPRQTVDTSGKLGHAYRQSTVSENADALKKCLVIPHWLMPDEKLNPACL